MLCRCENFKSWNPLKYDHSDWIWSQNIPDPVTDTTSQFTRTEMFIGLSYLLRVGVEILVTRGVKHVFQFVVPTPRAVFCAPTVGIRAQQGLCSPLNN
jgi:hypothetical protein